MSAKSVILTNFSKIQAHVAYEQKTSSRQLIILIVQIYTAQIMREYLDIL